LAGIFWMSGVGLHAIVYPDIGEEQNRVNNQFREQLFRFFPQLLKLSPSADEAWLWDLFEKPRCLLRRLNSRKLKSPASCVTTEFGAWMPCKFGPPWRGFP
jgi:hypothetical protein